ncbi:hypothetical protein CAL7716_069510 [Calothrix sp. PCC 7716]|nr:hypothetical protein CAL7716_069510 [Calothrix sp. PCC 7716]
MKLLKTLLIANWELIADKAFINKLLEIDWQAIFLKLIMSEKCLCLNAHQAILTIYKYGLFLYLISKYPDKKMVPNQEIDAALHAHITNHDKFEKDCINLFNNKLVHVPEVGINPEERQEWLLTFSETQKLFERNFGQDAMGSSTAACCELLLSFK